MLVATPLFILYDLPYGRGPFFAFTPPPLSIPIRQGDWTKRDRDPKTEDAFVPLLQKRRGGARLLRSEVPLHTALPPIASYSYTASFVNTTVIHPLLTPHKAVVPLSSLRQRPCCDADRSSYKAVERLGAAETGR